MSVTIKEAQELANKRLPIPGWVKTGKRVLTTVGSEVYGVNVVKQLDRKGGWTYLFEPTPPVPVAKAVEHPREVIVREDRRQA